MKDKTIKELMTKTIRLLLRAEIKQPAIELDAYFARNIRFLL
jgi:hypothetical protein